MPSSDAFRCAPAPIRHARTQYGLRRLETCDRSLTAGMCARVGPRQPGSWGGRCCRRARVGPRQPGSWGGRCCRCARVGPRQPGSWGGRCCRRARVGPRQPGSWGGRCCRRARESAHAQRQHRLQAVHACSRVCRHGAVGGWPSLT
eukprot:351609-Chlamydomonas_euryale.AAC.8